MLVWDYEQGVEYDDERGTNGFNRPDVNDAWIMAHALDDERDATASLREQVATLTAQRHVDRQHAEAIERVAFDVVTGLGEHARQYAIEQGLCGYFERYLSIAVAGDRDAYLASEDDAATEFYRATREEQPAARSAMLVQRFGRALTEALVTSASRPRKFTVSAPVVVTTSIPSVHAPSVDSYSVGRRIRNSDPSTLNIRVVDDGDAEVQPGEPFTYEEVQRLNENFHRRGEYAANAGESW